jgi:hypothetical protein
MNTGPKWTPRFATKSGAVQKNVYVKLGKTFDIIKRDKKQLMLGANELNYQVAHPANRE